MILLTEKQAQLLEFIKWFQKRNDGIAPSFQEMMEGCDLKSKSGVHRLLAALEERGRIRRMTNRARALEIVESPPEPEGLEAYPAAMLIAELARRGHFNRRAA